MRKDAEKEKQKILKLNEADYPAFKIKNDPRFTGKFGKFLSHTGLDELPQLSNILKGEMAFVGPRPLPVEEEKQIKKKYRRIRQQVLPGIISPWIFSGYHTIPFRKWMDLDLQYIKNKNFKTDVFYLIKGFFAIIKLSLSSIF